MSRTPGYGLGAGRRVGSPALVAPSPMIDILLATLGIFVVIFALQEIARPQDLVPRPYDALLLCGADRQTVLHTAAGATPLPYPLRDPVPDLRAALPGGGRVFAGLAEPCMSRIGNLLSVRETFEDMARRLEDLDIARPGFLVEIGPVSAAPPYDAESLLHRWRNPGATR